MSRLGNLKLSKEPVSGGGTIRSMTFISAAIVGLALLATPQAQDQRAEAERLARSGAHEQALKEFQALAALNPDDIEARLWIARLHVLSWGIPSGRPTCINRLSRRSRRTWTRCSASATR